MAEGFWLTDAGIDLRLADLSQYIVTRTFNNALQKFAPDVGIKTFAFMTSRDSRVCPDCDSHDVQNSGMTYRAGQFMPMLPRHPGCRCEWDIYVGISGV